MVNDRENLVKINQLALSIVEKMLKDSERSRSIEDLQVIENLSRTIVDLTNIQLGKDGDPATTLKASLIRTRLSYNSVVKENLVNYK